MNDIMQELAYFSPLDLNTLPNHSNNIPSHIQNSILLYNRAIENIRTGSEDIAIIELKKAISMNPDFCEAINLLGVCYHYVNDQQKAMEMFRRVVEIESNSVKALKYIENLEMPQGKKGTVSKSNNKKVIIKDTPVKVPIKSEHTRWQDYFKMRGKQDFIKVLIGIVAGVVLTLVISLPFKNYPKASVDISATPDVSIQQNDLQVATDPENTLKKDYERLVNELQAANQKNNYYMLAMKLFEIQDFIKQKKITEAADSLLLLKNAGLSGAEQQLYMSLYQVVMPQVANQTYFEGKKLFDTGNYQGAVERLEKVSIFMPDSDKVDDALYYIGKSYIALEESRKALSVFQQLIETYPKSNYAKYAQYRIDLLKGLP